MGELSWGGRQKENKTVKGYEVNKQGKYGSGERQLLLGVARTEKWRRLREAFGPSGDTQIPAGGGEDIFRPQGTCVCWLAEEKEPEPREKSSVRQKFSPLWNRFRILGVVILAKTSNRSELHFLHVYNLWGPLVCITGLF